MSTPAILALQDGTVFHGTSIGADGQTIGEVVFNTAMTGYQEILTDPSYCRQIVTLTYPHIGNTGTNSEDMESPGIHASGLIIRDSTMLTSSWRSERTLTDFLKQGGLVAIADIDTRKLTRIIREKGAQSGCIMTSRPRRQLNTPARSRGSREWILRSSSRPGISTNGAMERRSASRSGS